jgi:polysaccharide biosynthesis protein PslH
LTIRPYSPDVRQKIAFLAWESPWPSFGGGELRTMGLLKQLSRWYDVDLKVFTNHPLQDAQVRELSKITASIANYRLRNGGIVDLVRNLVVMLVRRCPYHCAVAYRSVMLDEKARKEILHSNAVVYASYGQWGTLALADNSSRWILDQNNADIHFWRVYADQVRNLPLKVAARVNAALARLHYPPVYRRVDEIISVCHDDRALTGNYCPLDKIHVIENGVDCSFMAPRTDRVVTGNRLLFTGTSVNRNMIVLRRFALDILPRIASKVPGVRLTVGGNFSAKAQMAFKQHSNIEFTGRLEDLRPLFDSSDIFVAPFDGTYGSKLKIAEAMAMGMCIVSTADGIRGFDLVDNESVVLARNDEEFAVRVVELLGSPLQRKAIGEQARRVALATVDWNVLGTRLRGIVDEAIAEHRRSESTAPILDVRLFNRRMITRE